MGYSKELFQYALNKLSSRRNEAKARVSTKKAELYSHLPRLSAIEDELAGTGVQLVHAVMTGKQSTAEAVESIKHKNLALQNERTQLLNKAGVGADYLEPHYVCTKCNDEGYLDGKMCDCLKKILRDEKLRRLNSTSSLSLSHFQNFRLDYYPTEPNENGIVPREKMAEIYEQCVQFAKNFHNSNGRNLMMMGATGLGKTHLSLAIAAEVIAQGYEVVYGSLQDLVRRTESEKFSREGSGYETLDTLLACDLLILDDLGSEFVTGFTSSTIYNIINTRINHHKSTIISTNLQFKELNDQYADRVISRLIGSYTILWFCGNDVRRILLDR